MKLLLTAINAKYIHTNLALHSLRAYAKGYDQHLELVEFTINNRIDDILREVYKKKPDVMAISTYIWNVEMVQELIVELKKVLPHLEIWLGGPEVSFDSKQQLQSYPSIKGILIGEGEATFRALLKYYVEKSYTLDQIAGLVFRDEADNIVYTGNRPLLNLSEIPFPYEASMDRFENKIIYYESARGCPFNCQYCLSSLDRGVRIRDIALVKEELQHFLNAKVKQVKFVDRTFNCNKKHAMAVWEYIHKNDNGFTNFHFEISADLIDEEMVAFLTTVRPGLFQFEIGVQSTHPETLEIIQRKMDFDKLSRVVKNINKGRNIHQHLDLIAGLPREDYATFKKSFNDVYALEPEQLQLGFLKVLKGSGMYENSHKYGLLYKEKTPYEILSTKDISYEEVLKLKLVEEMVELYHNSNQFTYSLKYLLNFFSAPFDLFEALAEYYEEKEYHTLQHSRMTRYDIVLEFFQDKLSKEDDIIKALLLFDLYLQENLKKRPIWYEEDMSTKEQTRKFYQDQENINKYLAEYKDYASKQISRMTHIELFSVDIMPFVTQGKDTFSKKDTYVLFNYLKRDPLVNHATTTQVIL
jgi:radical SAM superfamily enzyme YgiQ (UPF0313 family)